MADLSAVSFFIYIYLVLAAVNYGDSLNTEEDIPLPLCSRKCHSTNGLNATDVSLFMCSCSSSCSTFGDCCYDSDYRNETTWKEIDFICLSVSNRGQYKAVSGCPAHQNSGLCKIAIGHGPPVTSRVTNTTYANIFCANCNGDGENVDVWNVELRCADRDGDAEISVSDTTKILYENGHLWRLSETTGSVIRCMYHVHVDNFTLLDSLELRFCYTAKKKSDCSPQWKNSTIMQLCRSYEDPIYIGSNALRNTHCAMCNYMPTNSAQCFPIPMEVKQRSQYYESRAVLNKNVRYRRYSNYTYAHHYRPHTFSRFIDPNACTPDPGTGCCPHEKYDFRSKQCRQFFG